MLNKQDVVQEDSIGDVIVTRTSSYSIVKKGGSRTDVVAPTIEGYTFLCWIGATTSGWIGSCYFGDNRNASTTLWNSTRGETSEDIGYVMCYALYKKNNMM